jgi:hypothetical protein
MKPLFPAQPAGWAISGLLLVGSATAAVPPNSGADAPATPPETVAAGWIEPSLAHWRAPRGTWTVVGGVALNAQDRARLQTQPGRGVLFNHLEGKTVDLLSRDEFGDCEVRLEFNVPANSNSGVYLMARYEVQILDSWGKAEPGWGDCGGIYARYADGKSFEGSPPRINASRPPGEWQSLEIHFRAPRFDTTGRKTESARFLRVVLNGHVVQENVEVSGPTRAATYDNEAPIGPLMLQGDHGPVAFRHLQVVPFVP